LPLYPHQNLRAIKPLRTALYRTRHAVRFDDRLETILKPEIGLARPAAAVWAQIISVLAQNSDRIDDDQKSRALQKAEQVRAEVPVLRRKFLAQSIADKLTDPALVLHFGKDAAAVAAPVMTRATLEDAQWSALIPELPSSSRALLRERRDLPETTKHLLGLYGSADRALPSADVTEHAGETERENLHSLQIRDLVARIEAFKTDRSATPQLSTFIDVDSVQVPGLNFRFETDRAGVINWVDGVARGPLIGISFSEHTGPRAFGVDGYATGAFRKRAPFRDARLRVAGNSDAAGDWLISADPCFDSVDGRFRGYRGHARRAGQSSATDSAATPLFGADMSPDSIRQLVHELRSPINAIKGFAEMIDTQMLGPVSHPYRMRARAIVSDAIKLVDLVDNIDMAARHQSSVSDNLQDGPADVIAMIEAALDRIENRTSHASEVFGLSAESGLPAAAIDFKKGSELIERLMQTALTASDGVSPIAIDVSARGGQIITSINLQTGSDGGAVDHGLGFALRVIRQCAVEIGSQFLAESCKFALIMPHAHDSELKTIESK
jgi:signal transduction histidine kinase